MLRISSNSYIQANKWDDKKGALGYYLYICANGRVWSAFVEKPLKGRRKKGKRKRFYMNLFNFKGKGWIKRRRRRRRLES